MARLDQTKREPQQPEATGGRGDVVVFDIGGTYFRSALYSPGRGLSDIRRQPAISFRSHPHLAMPELRKELVAYLSEMARAYRAAHGASAASVSLGAALDARSGTVYGSGPLWGGDTTSFDLLAALEREGAGLRWSVVNDVTAALIHYASLLGDGAARKVLLLTVSTGIACRLLDLRRGKIPVDPFGLQGEIGHIPVILGHAGEAIELTCDCGKPNHLAAFSSGRGIEKLAMALARRRPQEWRDSALSRLVSEGLPLGEALRQAFDLDDPCARTLLSLATRPVADVIRTSLALDPEIDHIVLTGGVAVNLGHRYNAMLSHHFIEDGLYLSSRFSPGLIEERITIASPQQADGLAGAGLYAARSPAEALYE